MAQYYPNEYADDFTPIMLKQFREIQVEKGKWSRMTINRRIDLIRRMFRWAAAEMMISTQTYMSLMMLDGLQKGRTMARECKKVLPVDIACIEAILPILTPVVADMVRVQLLTGMRSGEVIKLRAADIDRSDKIWKYVPTGNEGEYAHKTEYRGIEKYIAIGPKAQKVLAKYLFRESYDYCFKPAESAGQARQRQSKNDKDQAGIKIGGGLVFNNKFDAGGYRRAIQRACSRAGIDKWHPHQLRHTTATEISNQFDIESARAVLGHSAIKQTQEYVDRDFAKAKKIVEAMG